MTQNNTISLFNLNTKIRDQEVFCDDKYYKINKSDYTPELVGQVDLYNDMYVHEFSPNNSFDAVSSFEDLILLYQNMRDIAGKLLLEVTRVTNNYGTELSIYGNQSCPEGFTLIHIEPLSDNKTCEKTCFSGEITSDTPILS